MLSIRPNITFMLMKLQRHVIFICIDVKIRNFPKRFRSFMYLPFLRSLRAFPDSRIVVFQCFSDHI